MIQPLLTLEDIARLHSCTVRQARDIIVKLPGFPAEAPTSTARLRRWVAAEVHAHITRQKQTLVAVETL